MAAFFNKKILVLCVICVALVVVLAQLEREIVYAPFALPHANLKKLDSGIEALAQVQQKLAAIQTTSSAREAVAAALYPINFLRDLSSLEKARRAWEAAPSRIHENAYREILSKTNASYQSDLARFTAAYEAQVPISTANFATASGIVSRESTLRTLERLRTPHERTLSSVATSSAATDILKLYSLSMGRELTGPVYELAQSVCTPVGAAPLFASASYTYADTQFEYPLFVGDVFFYDTLRYPDVEYYRYYADRGTAYVLWRPLSHYSCPAALLDVRAVAAARGQDGFENFILHMAMIEDNDLALYASGVPVALDAKYLFYVRSGFFALFLGTRDALPTTASKVALPVVRYTQTSESERQELLRDMKFFFTLHP